MGKTMELTSGILTVDQVKAELEAFPDILSRHGVQQLVAFIGIGSSATIDEMWKPHELETAQLSEFAQRSTARDLFRPGESDLFVETKDQSTKLLFCHESDIHVETTNASLVEEVTERWKRQGFLMHQI